MCVADDRNVSIWDSIFPLAKRERERGRVRAYVSIVKKVVIVYQHNMNKSFNHKHKSLISSKINKIELQLFRDNHSHLTFTFHNTCSYYYFRHHLLYFITTQQSKSQISKIISMYTTTITSIPSNESTDHRDSLSCSESDVCSSFNEANESPISLPRYC